MYGLRRAETMNTKFFPEYKKAVAYDNQGRIIAVANNVDSIGQARARLLK
jgi:hypothetical protein